MKTSYLLFFITLFLLAGCKSEERKAHERFEARKMLSDIGIEYTKDEYIKRIEEGDYTAVELFLKAGMTVNVDKKAGDYAISNGHISILELLFDYGLDANDQGLVLEAIRENNIEILRLLKKKGADFNRIHELRWGWARKRLPLEYALDRKNYEVAEWLVDNGASLRGWQRGGTPMSELYITDDLKEEAPSLYRKLRFR